MAITSSLCTFSSSKSVLLSFHTQYIHGRSTYIINVVLQIWLLGVFLGTNFLQFGFESLRLFRYGLNQPESEYFPRETFCDFHVREPMRGGQPLQRITVQCVLTVNLFNQVSSGINARTVSDESFRLQQIFTLLWVWYVFVFFCNIYSLILWVVRLSSYRQQYNFIHSRLARTSRPEIPRFRFDFKHANWELGDHVQEALVNAFLTEYLEADGYFFIRLLTANASDFVVQEILEQLWTMYVMKYGEIDATRAEKAYFEYRNPSARSPSITHTSSPFRHIFNPISGANDAKRKFAKQHPHQNVALLDEPTETQPVFQAIPEHGESV